MNARCAFFTRVFAVAVLLTAASFLSAQVARDVEMVPTGKGYGVAVEIGRAHV